MGGAVGYWAYDFGRRLEPLPEIARDDLNLPDFVLGLYDVVGAFDPRDGRAWLVSTRAALDGPRRDEHARAAARVLRVVVLGAAFHRRRRASACGVRTALDVRARRLPARHRADPGSHRARRHLPGQPVATLDRRPRGGRRHARRAARSAPLARLATDLHEALAERSPAPFAAFLGASRPRRRVGEPRALPGARRAPRRNAADQGTRPRGTASPRIAGCARSCSRAPRTAPRTS